MTEKYSSIVNLVTRIVKSEIQFGRLNENFQINRPSTRDSYKSQQKRYRFMRVLPSGDKKIDNK